VYSMLWCLMCGVWTSLSEIKVMYVCMYVLPPKHEKCREIRREFDLTAVQGHVIDLGVNGEPICDFILVINSNFSRICYCVRDIHG